MAKGMPKCKICKTNHFGICGVGDARGIETAPTNDFEITRDVIRRGKRTFIEVGEALITMHEKKLYKQGGFDSFAEFCESEGLTRGYAYQVMEGTRAVSKVSDNLTSVTASQGRELVKTEKILGTKAAQEVWDETGPEHRPRDMSKAVQQRLGSGEVEQPCSHPNVKCVDCGKKVQRV